MKQLVGGRSRRAAGQVPGLSFKVLGTSRFVVTSLVGIVLEEVFGESGKLRVGRNLRRDPQRHHPRILGDDDGAGPICCARKEDAGG